MQIRQVQKAYKKDGDLLALPFFEMEGQEAIASFRTHGLLLLRSGRIAPMRRCEYPPQLLEAYSLPDCLARLKKAHGADRDLLGAIGEEIEDKIWASLGWGYQ